MAKKKNPVKRSGSKLSGKKEFNTLISEILILVKQISPDAPLSPSELAKINSMCETAIDLSPKNITPHFIYAYFLSETGIDLELATEEFSTVLRLSVNKKWQEKRFGFNEDCSTVAYRLGNIAVTLNKHRDAIHWWERALYFNSQNEDALSSLINILLEMGLLEEATKRVLRLSPEDVMFHYYTGLISYRRGDIKTMTHNCREALKTNPQHGSSQILLSVGLIYQNQFEEARKLLLDARARIELTNEESHLLTYWLITAYYRNNNLLEARIESERLLQLVPSLSDSLLSSVHVILGECYYNEARDLSHTDPNKSETLMQEALSNFETACDLFPDNSEAHWHLGKYYLFVNGDRDRSYSEYIKAYELGASSEAINEYFEPLINWAERYASVREPAPEDRNLFSSWQRLLMKNIQKDPTNLNGHYFLARLFFITRQFSSAIEELTRAIEIAEMQQNTPILAELYSKLTFANFEKGNISEGLKIYERYEQKQQNPHTSFLTLEENLKNHETSWQDYLALGRAYAEAGHYNEGETLLLRTLQSIQKEEKIPGAGYTATMKALGDVYLQQGKLVQAQDAFSNVLEKDPRNIEVLHNMTGALKGLRKHAQAKKFYEKILKLDPNNSLIANEYADLCMEMAKSSKENVKKALFHKAKQLYHRALDINKDHGTYYDLATVYKQKGDLKRAIEMILEAIKMAPNNPEYFKLLVSFYEKIGAFTTARLLKIHSEKYFLIDEIESMEIIGRANGLWVTEDEKYGGIITIQASAMPGTGRFTRTGNILKIMRESTDVAYSYVRENAKRFGITDFDKKDIHIHFVSSGTAAELKEGPSAGTAIATAIISALGRYPVKPHVAMTGELFLNGVVGRIGGLDGKIRGALEAGMTTLCIPHQNAQDFQSLSASTFTPETISKMEFVFARTIEDVLQHTLKNQIIKLKSNLL